MDDCFICKKKLSDGDTVVVTRGLETLRKSSLARKDQNILFLQNVTSVTVHDACRKTYTRESDIAAHVKRASASVQSPVTTRSATPGFDFNINCLFCGKEANETKEKKKSNKERAVICHVRTLTFKNSIMKTIDERKDDWARQIQQRITNVMDLVAVEAKYHQKCNQKFFLPPQTGKKRSRPVDENVTEAMNTICSYIENSDDCQFTLTELKGILSDFVPSDKTIITRLIDLYGDNIVVSTQRTSSRIITFRDKQHDILTNSWYEKRNSDRQEERLRILEAAASIIREDIRSVICNTDTFPAPDKFLNNANASIPKSLTFFLNNVIMKNKKGNKKPLETKSTAIAHAIMCAVRPRSFLSPLHLGIASYLHRKFASKSVINILSNLGFCATYHDTLLFEVSCIYHPRPQIIPKKSFVQFIFDNADFNIDTIDGLNTFHSMGGIHVVTPGNSVAPAQEMVRQTVKPTAREIGQIGRISLKMFEKTNGSGLKTITINDISDVDLAIRASIQNSDVLWMFGKWQSIPSLPGWNGFMEKITAKMPFEESKVICLPFVNAPPTSSDTINTVLHTAMEHCKAAQQRTCFVTFDQPLYLKARDIIATYEKTSEMSTIVIRLGGFHLLMSFLGSIGYIMAGSGLKEVLSVIYAPVSVDKMLTGHAYSRAIRGHILVQLALSYIIMEDITMNAEDREMMRDLLADLTNATPSLNLIQDSQIIQSFKEKFELKLSEFEHRGPTSKLWIQYFELVSIVKQFLQSERMGDWSLHLACVNKMLPYFHSAGHFAYAKTCRLYLQDMQKLEEMMDAEEFKKYTHDGYFTIRRSSKFWSGIWSDMTIEQTLMRSLKVSGGLTHGKGLTDSVQAKWILGMSSAYDVCESVERFCNVNLSSVEQHVDARDSRVTRDNADLRKLLDWFQSHTPFPVLQDIMSISTGVIGDENINCYNARDIGITSMKAIVGSNFSDVKMKRNHRVSSLLAVNSSVKIYDTVTPINPLLLFQRISVTKKTDDELRNCLQYELAPYPLSLFDEAGMRKTKKSSLYEVFKETSLETDTVNFTHIIDGGFLLHRVVWHQHQTYDSICETYIDYVTRHYGLNSTIVFDGYDESSTNTKEAERLRRSTKNSSAEVRFDSSMQVTVSQETFLSNNNNKSRLISMLTKKFRDSNFIVKQAQADADTLIIMTAIDQSSLPKPVVVIGEDVDLLVLLTALTPLEKLIYFVKPGRGKVGKKVYSSRSLDAQDHGNERILFIHAMTGCDTTSAIYNKGKKKGLQLMEKQENLRICAAVFNQPDASHADIRRNGEAFILALFGAQKNETSLDDIRYSTFVKLVRKNKAVNLASLPPTSSAAQEHSYRVYQQIQNWRGNQLPPQNWGWKTSSQGLYPITMEKSPAPESLLKLISCNCTKGCGSGCGCRKAGLHCSTICGHCYGQACLNSPPTEVDTEDYEDEGILDDPDIELVLGESQVDE